MASRTSIRSSRPDVLIVPLDGSKTAERAVPMVIQTAVSLGVPVCLLHVFNSIRQLRHYAEGDIEWSENADPRALLHAPASIREPVEMLERAGIAVTVVGRVGKASEEICKEIRRNDSAWTVMSSLGATGVRKLFLGSTSRNVVRGSTGPVIVIPGHAEMPESDSAKGSSVTVLLDGTQVSEQSICFAAGIAEGSGAELELLRVAETYRDDAGAAVDEQQWESNARASAAEYLNEASAACKDLDVSVTTTVLAGNPITQITRHIKNTRPMLIALATRRRSGIERWTYGSVAEKVVDSVSIPLMLVPVDEE